MLTVTSSMASYCSPWMIPRLSALRTTHLDVYARMSANTQILDLDHERFNLAIRYCPAPVAPLGSIRTYCEETVPASKSSSSHWPK
jgi:DNA-binding transcriptional LysR family regulator